MPVNNQMMNIRKQPFVYGQIVIMGADPPTRRNEMHIVSGSTEVSSFSYSADVPGWCYRLTIRIS